MLGYRTIFELPGRRESVEGAALSQLRAWLRSKHLDADALDWGREVPLATHATGLLQELGGGDESRSVRARIVESGPTGDWTSTLTVHVPGDTRRAPWVWLDIDGPEGARTGLPRLARMLLEVLSDARDDIAVLRAEPEIISAADAPDLAELLLDESRRRLVFVAGSDAQMPIPRWKGLLTELLNDTVGLASAYVLDASATKSLARALGPHHAVTAGTVRTFADHVAPGDPLDAQRHRVLTTQRILRGDTRAVARLLGGRARSVALQQPLPHAAVRVDRLLERQLDELVLTESSAATATPARPAVREPGTVEVAATHAVQAVEAAVTTPEPVRAGPTGVAAAPAAGASSSVMEADTRELVHLRRAVELLLGTVEPTPAELEQARGLLARGRAAESQQGALAARLTHLQDQLDSAHDEVAELRRQLEDEKLESAAALTAVADSDRLVRHLRALAVANDPSSAWSEPDAEPEPPTSFAELVERLDELTLVSVTMPKPDPAIALDDNDPLGTWAKKSWQALCALEDYARSKASGTWTKDVDTYLRETPSGCRSFSATRHALDESTTVKSNPKFRDARLFTVPATVDASGRTFMGAHFKIAQSGMISPRLHYLDATGSDGRVYVGYIGAHLPTKRTN